MFGTFREAILITEAAIQYFQDLGLNTDDLEVAVTPLEMLKTELEEAEITAMEKQEHDFNHKDEQYTGSYSELSGGI